MEKYANTKAIKISRKLRDIESMSRNQPIKQTIQSSTPQPLSKYLVKSANDHRDMRSSKVSILSVSKFGEDSVTEISVFETSCPIQDRLTVYHGK